MTGILPANGVPPENTRNGLAAPLLAGGCDNIYYGPRCNPRMDPFAMNAVISEVINALNAIGLAYDCNRLDNLASAFLTFGGAPIAQPAGAPAAIIQHRTSSGVNAGVTPPTNAWSTRPLNLKSYDPGNIVSLVANQFTVNVASFVSWESIFKESLRSKTRIFNVTDGVVTDVGLSVTASEIGSNDDTVANSTGGAFLVAGKTYRLEVWVETDAGAGPGDTGNSTLGRPSSSGVDELYAVLRFWRLA